MWKTITCVSLVIVSLLTQVNAFTYGVNIHPKMITTWDKTIQVAAVLSARNIRNVRIDLSPYANVTYMRGMVSIFKSYNVAVEAMLYDPTVNTYVCGGQASEATAYNVTYTFVDKMKDLITVWELQNERMLVINRNGIVASDFNTTCGILDAAVSRGMANAVRAVSAASGIQLRIIQGFVFKAYGFIDFMISQNVTFDIIGYHIYPYQFQTVFAVDPWFGTGGFFNQVKRFGKPLRINEYNCGETYNQTGYGNVAGDYQTEQCYKSIKKHLPPIVNQTLVTLESVSFYELFDQPELLPSVEANFGIMYNVTSPKIQLYLISAFAGGNLTVAESFEITNRSLLTTAEIATYKAAATTTAPAPTTTVAPTTAAPTTTVAGTTTASPTTTSKATTTAAPTTTNAGTTTATPTTVTPTTTSAPTTATPTITGAPTTTPTTVAPTTATPTPGPTVTSAPTTSSPSTAPTTSTPTTSGPTTTKAPTTTSAPTTAGPTTASPTTSSPTTSSSPTTLSPTTAAPTTTPTTTSTPTTTATPTTTMAPTTAAPTPSPTQGTSTSTSTNVLTTPNPTVSNAGIIDMLMSFVFVTIILVINC